MRARVVRAIALLVALSSCGGADEGDEAEEVATGLDGMPIAALQCERDKHVKVAFTSPAAVANRAFGPLQSALVDVGFTAKVDNGSGFIDSGKLQLLLLDASGLPLLASPVTQKSGEFHATFDLSTRPNGAHSFRATALTTSGKCGRAESAVLLDLGPTIRAASPVPRAIFTQSMEVLYEVEPAPMGPGDELAAAIDRHYVSVAGREIQALPNGASQRVVIGFNDPALFPTPLQGTYDLEIVARNRRTPTPGERRVKIPFVVDSKGPRISIKSPKDGDVVGGSAPVQVEILDDGSGLDPAKLALSAGQVATPLTAIEGKKGMYEGRIDLSGLGTTVQETTIAVLADDLASNHSVQTVSVKLDGLAPLVSLDPPAVRIAKLNSTNNGLVCSTLFDPLGSDSVNDGMIVGTAAEFRARIEDVTNSSVGSTGSLRFLAGVDDDDVQLYLNNKLDQKLLIDKDGDGICDEINPVLVPSVANASEGAAVVQLKPAPPTNSGAFYSASEDVTATPADVAYHSPRGSVFSQCQVGTDKIVPKPTCVTSPLTEILHADGLADTAPAIYGKAPIAPMQRDNCAGDAYDYQNQLKTPGWACVAVRVSDKVGNVAVSAPLRVCFDNGSGACGGSFGDVLPEAQRPSCTANCTPPPAFESYPAYQLVEHTR